MDFFGVENFQIVTFFLGGGGGKYEDLNVLSLSIVINYLAVY